MTYETRDTKYETAVNLKTAKALGISLPASLLFRADEVIEYVERCPLLAHPNALRPCPRSGVKRT